MTSPSIYLVFDHLQAMSSTDLDLTCSVSSPLGATGTMRWAGGGAISSVGGPYTNAVVSLDATGLSSLVRDLGPVNTASVVSEIAHGGPSYSYWINAVRGTGRNYGTGYITSVMAKSVDHADFMVPDAEAYYMNINGAPGCNRMGDHPQCSTIYDGAYKAQLLVPKEVRTLRPEWAECFDPLFGALDPPIALTQVATIKGPKPPLEPAKETPATETPKQTTPKQTPPSDQPKQTKPAVPGNTVPGDSSPTTPPPKTSPTALPGTKPEDEPNTQDPSDPDDKPADNGTPNDDAKPSNSDKPSNNDKPSDNGNPSDHSNPSDNDSPSSNGNPSSSENSSNNDDSSNKDKPKGNGDNSSEGPTQNGDSADKPQNDASGSSSSDDQNAASGGASDKKPQNALDVLTAAQQSDGAKATASPGSGNSKGSGDGDSAESGGSDDEDGTGGATGSSSNGNSGATQGQGSGGNSDSDESNGHQTGSNNQNSDSDNSDDGDDSNDASAGSNANAGSVEQVVNVDGKTHTVAKQNGVTIIDGTQLPTDGSPMTVHGQSVKAVDGGVVIGTQTVELVGGQTAYSQAAVFTANGQAFTAVRGSTSGVAVVYGTTLSVGGHAVTAHGATISAASNGVVVDGSTIDYEDASSTGDAKPAVLTLGSNAVTASAVGSGRYAFGTVTLTAGGPDATISGHTVSAATSGVVIDGSSSLSDASKTQSSQATQSTSNGPDGQSPAEGSEASKLCAIYWAALMGCVLLLLL
jgi:hypothetical protein